MGETLYSHAEAEPRNSRTRRDDAERRQAATLAHLLRSGYGGYQTDNRRVQSDQLKGDVYLGWDAVSRAVQGATAQLTRLSASPAKPNRVTKAMPTPHAHANDEQRRPVLRGPLVKLFERPNAGDTLASFLAKWRMQEMLTGNVLVWGNPDRVGRVREMFILPTALCQWQPYQSSTCPRGAWRVMPYYAGGLAGVMPYGLSAGALIPAHQVVHFKRPHPYYLWDGYSPMTAASKWVDLIESIDQACWASMDHGMSRGTTIVMPGLSPDEALEQTERLRREKGGARNSRTPTIIGSSNPEAKVEIHDPDAPKDMEYQQGRQAYASLVLALMGVPPEIAGVRSPGSYAAYYAARKQFRDDTLTPWLAGVAAELTRGIVGTWDADDSVKLQFDLPPFNNEEQQESVKTRQQSNGLVTYNEARRGDNLPPVDDSDADKLPFTIYMQKLAQKAQPQPPQGMPGVPSDGPNAGDAPNPDNPAGKGSLPPQAKAFDLSAGVSDWMRRKGWTK